VIDDASFARAMTRIVAVLPFGLSRIVAPSLVGFVLINSLTFSLDISLLTICHGLLGWPLPASITISYVTAFGLSYLLNRRFNFRSHAPVGGQLPSYVAVVLVNYLVWILGVGDGLTHRGVDYRVARIVAGGCEAVFMYVALRWVVFRDVRTRGASGTAHRDL
jgi:putative flippase GtrA